MFGSLLSSQGMRGKACAVAADAFLCLCGRIVAFFHIKHASVIASVPLSLW